jgi:Cu2+-exporting ATPase
LKPAETPGAATAHCPHCGTAVEGAEDAYCCRGCEAAYAIIHGAGLDAYYAMRETFAPRPEPDHGGWSAVPVAEGPDGTCETRLMIDGLRCASCVWVIERVLERTPGVESAEVSYATGRVSLRWDPRRVDLSGLAHRISALGYRPRVLGEEAAPDRDLLLRVGVAAFASMNIMMLAASLYVGWFDAMDPAYAALFRWANLVLATPVALWCAQPFFVGAWAGLRRRVLHMDLPIALGIALLYAHGVVATLTRHEAYLDSLAMLVTLLLVGRILEGRGRRRAVDAAMALAASAPRTARRQRGESLETIPADQLRRGDVIDVGAGEEFAADGVVVEGAGQVRMALMTGEAAPVAVRPGDRVVAGTILVDGALSVQVEAVGGDTALRRMAAHLERAADRGVRPTAADRIAPWFTAATLVIAAVTFAGWWWGRGIDVAVARTAAVLVVACPCALALSQSLAAAAGLGAAARRGLLLRSADALLDLSRVDLIVLDKTGTVTAGLMQVLDATDHAIRVASGLERYSNHPIARAIIEEAGRRHIPLPAGRDVHETAGFGITGVVDAQRWTLASAGPGILVLSSPDSQVAFIHLGDAARPDALHTVQQLQGEGLEVALLTGDHHLVAERIAGEVGIATVESRATPEAKAAWIEARRAEGRVVLFAGDGANDGLALGAADVGVAMGTGAASSVLVADGVIASASLAPLLAGRRAAMAAARIIRSNQRRSLAYNVLAVSAAVAGLVNPLVAALLMPLSSGLVIWGASRVEPLVRAAER